MKHFAMIGMITISSIVSYAGAYRVPQKPASISVADIDHDGDLDIILGHEVPGIGGLVSILINNGKGEFCVRDTISTGAYEYSIQLGNMNNNTLQDIVMLDYHEASKSTSFSTVYDYGSQHLDSVKQYPLYRQVTIWNYVVSDLNSDHYDDIVFISNLSKIMGIVYNNGNGEYSAPQYFDLDFYPNSLAIGDLNGDGRNDIAISGNGEKIRIYLTTATGFGPLNVDTSPKIVSDIKISDINNDGKNEIIGIDGGIGGTKKRIMIYSRDESGNFHLTYAGQWINEAMSQICIADLNNDAYPDIIFNVSIYYPNSDYELFHTYILFNNKDGTFQDPVNYYTGICSHLSYAADLNGDGWKDIITLNYDFYNPPPDTCTIHILFSDGSGKFSEEPTAVLREHNKEVIRGFALNQNYPNPFNSSTVFSYQLPVRTMVTLKVYDLLGRELQTLVNQEGSAGAYKVEWDATGLPSGVFIVQLVAGTFSASRMLMLLK